ncbi:hypothetical protein [Paraburkholderia susongensis]|uniref:hypothetical protein n=1 Tax=Paraburkholderia susongensis TaxID=1515439 RepID=UPI000A1CDE55|nr:hypothetical protein [Paraburkholderia susongensis]
MQEGIRKKMVRGRAGGDVLAATLRKPQWLRTFETLAETGMRTLSAARTGAHRVSTDGISRRSSRTG